MKTSIYYLLVLSTLFFVFGCSEDEHIKPELVQFTFTMNGSEMESGRTETLNLPTGTVLRISIEHSNGSSAFVNKEIELIKMDEHYITAPLELTPGAYRITTFMIVDANAQVIYLAPLAGSPLSSHVDNALPYSFTVSKDKVNSIAMQVLSASQRAPEAFGYVSFSFDVLHLINVSIAIPVAGRMTLTDATAYLIDGADTIADYSLKAKVNRLTVHDIADTVTLVVVKDGYRKYSKTNLLTDLINEKIITITMTPAFTLRLMSNWVVESQEFPTELDVHGENGIITVDWGDGTVNDYTLSNDLRLSHFYPRAETPAMSREYFVTVTGAIENIQEIANTGDNSIAVKTMYIKHLFNLKIFSMSFSPLNKIDFGSNTRLESVGIGFNDNLSSVILPESHAIRYFSFSALNNLSSEDLSDLILNIYNNTNEKNIHNGLAQLWDDMSPEGEMSGPPNAEAMEKLRIMRDQFEWTVEPDPL